MGNAKNKKNPNANRGKYRKKEFTSISTITEVSSTENRIINLENLRSHMKEVTQHIASCRSCQEKALQKVRQNINNIW